MDGDIKVVSKKNQETVKNYVERFSSSRAFILADYQGLNVIEMNELRNSLRKDESEFVVVKNTSAAIAFKDSGINLEEYLTGPTGIVIVKSKNPVTPLKKLFDFSKDHEKFKIKSGYMFDQVFSVSEISKLKDLPSYEALVTKTVVSLNSLLVRLVNAVQSPLQKMVTVTNKIKSGKESGGK